MFYFECIGPWHCMNRGSCLPPLMHILFLTVNNSLICISEKFNLFFTPSISIGIYFEKTCSPVSIQVLHGLKYSYTSWKHYPMNNTNYIFLCFPRVYYFCKKYNSTTEQVKQCPREFNTPVHSKWTIQSLSRDRQVSLRY